MGVAVPKLKTVEMPFAAGPIHRSAESTPAGEPADPETLPFAFTAPPEWEATAPG